MTWPGGDCSRVTQATAFTRRFEVIPVCETGGRGGFDDEDDDPP